MAKEKGKFSFSDMSKSLNKIAKTNKNTSIIIQDRDNVVKPDLISTGIYTLNAALSGDILGGVPSNRITVFAGESGVGKSYLCYNIAREAQKMGYSIIYIDTEFAIEFDQLPNYGIDTDPEKFQLISSNIIEDIKIMMTQFLDDLKNQKSEGKEMQKIIIILDSIGMLASRKEVNDALDGKEKADFTKAKALGSFFRIINSDLGYLNIPLICTNHSYKTMDLYPVDTQKGGESTKYSASNICFLSKSKLKEEGEMDDLDMGQSGILVTAKMTKNRMVKPKKVKFEISFVSGSNKYVGLDYWLEDGEHFEEIGIGKGKVVDGTFIPGGNRWYVHHLGGHIKKELLFTSKVFTPEVLEKLRPIIKEYFRYKSITELEDLAAKMEDIKTSKKLDNESDDFDIDSFMDDDE